MSEKIVKYYTEEYCEEHRLSEGCDNRHITEREVKKRILGEYLRKGLKVADIGAGTGLYSIYAAEKGCAVEACDIVPHHVAMIERKAKEKGLSVKACVADARDLPYRDGVYDIVLVGGPIYHMHAYQDKVKLLSEAVRVCKPGGYIIVDFLSTVHGFIQHVLLDHQMLVRTSETDMLAANPGDPVFSYDNMESMVSYLLGQPVNMSSLKFFGTDGITRFLRGDVNSFSKEEIEKWIDFIYLHACDRDLIGLSEHCVLVVQKCK